MKGFNVKRTKDGNGYVATNVKGLTLKIRAINDDWYTGEIVTKLSGDLVYMFAAYRTVEKITAVANAFLDENATYIAEVLKAETV